MVARYILAYVGLIHLSYDNLLHLSLWWLDTSQPIVSWYMFVYDGIVHLNV